MKSDGAVADSSIEEIVSPKLIRPEKMEPSARAIRPDRVGIKVAPDDYSICAVSFREQAGKTRHINQIEGPLFSGKHRDCRALERHHMLPSLLQRKRIILRDGGEGEIDQEPKPPNHLIF